MIRHGFDTPWRRPGASESVKRETVRPDGSVKPNPRRLLATIVLAPIRLYQRLISPALPRRCKYEPTCSAYALEAIGRFGVARGLVLAAWRLARCNPFSRGGYDPVEAQTLFRSKHEVPA